MIVNSKVDHCEAIPFLVPFSFLVLPSKFEYLKNSFFFLGTLQMDQCTRLYSFFFCCFSFAVFAVGLLLQSTDVLDPRLILTTAEEPEWSANCVSEQIARSDLGFDVPVAIGETLPPYSERGAVCGIPGLIGFAMYETCAKPNPENPPPIPNGVQHAAKLLEDSDRSDWTYIAVGGQTSLQKLIRDYPDVLSKIKTLVVMGGNFCTGFDAYPDVPSPTAETNIGCDMAAANFVLEAAAQAAHQKRHFPAIQYVPIVTVNVLSGDDYALILDAASPSDNNPHYSKTAQTTIDFYYAWNKASRANKALLIHKEAMTFDPTFESTPQFDAVAVLIAMDIARGTSRSRVAQHEFAHGLHFVTNQEAAVSHDHPQFFKETAPPAAYSLWSGEEAFFHDRDESHPISSRCQDLTPYHFDPTVAPPLKRNENENQFYPPVAIQVALGFVSEDTERDFFHEMALRISGRFAPLSGSESESESTVCDASSIPTTSTKASMMGVAAAPVEELDPRRIKQNISAATAASSSSSSASTTGSQTPSVPLPPLATDSSAVA